MLIIYYIGHIFPKKKKNAKAGFSVVFPTFWLHSFLYGEN